MKLYQYWSNKTSAHDKLLAEILASDILEADKQFSIITKNGNNDKELDVVKCPWISCIVIDIK